MALSNAIWAQENKPSVDFSRGDTDSIKQNFEKDNIYV
jgi:hypothetical protein